MKYRVLALFCLALPAVALAGCKSDYEKFADDACACKDDKCMKDVSEKYKGLLGGEKATLKEMDEKMKALSDKDKTAFSKGFECVVKVAMGGDDKKDDKKEDKK
jgi:hypothetical protein